MCSDHNTSSALRQDQEVGTEANNPTFKIAATAFALKPLGWDCPVKSIANMDRDGNFDFVPKRGTVRRLRIPPGIFVDVVPVNYLDGSYAFFAPSKSFAEDLVKKADAAVVIGSPVSVMFEVARAVNQIFAENA